jgi:hypothetical protein
MGLNGRFYWGKRKKMTLLARAFFPEHNRTDDLLKKNVINKSTGYKNKRQR